MTTLFDRFDLHGVTLPNRVVMAPMTRTRADDDRTPTELMREYYVQRATAGLLITECTAVRTDSAGILRAPGIYASAQVDGWREITDAVHAAGGRVYLQIWHGGRISHPSLQPEGELPVAPSAVAAAGEIFTPEGRQPYPVPRALETAEIAPLVEDALDRADGPLKARVIATAVYFAIVAPLCWRLDTMGAAIAMVAAHGVMVAILIIMMWREHRRVRAR